MSGARNSPSGSPEQALRAIGLLFREGDVIEIRALNVDRGPNRSGITYSGYFEFAAGREIAGALAFLDGRADGIYVTLNRVNPDLLARARNRLQASPRHTTADADIIEWRWFYIDLDPVRPTGISASEEERQAAHERAIRIREFLSTRGWPESVYADSGNGAHLLYYLPVMDLDRAKAIVERCLKALDAQFSDSLVKVDTATANASRICKLYGTTARKGDPTPERPHRVASILEEPEKLTPVPVEALEALASETPANQSQSVNKSNHSQKVGGHFTRNLDLQQWLDDHRLDVEPAEPWKGGKRWIFQICPWNSEHRNKSAYLVQFPNGAIAAGCHHNGCTGNDWHALRDLVEPGWRSASGQQNEGAPYQVEWEPPIPFDQFNLPPFPTAVFPPWLRAFVEAEAKATQTPPDLASMLALSVVATACAKRVRIEVKPSYQEPLNLFTVTALPPGNRKNAVFKHVIKPVEDYEREEARRTALEIAKRQAARKIKESKLKKVQEKAASAKGLELDSLVEQATSLAAELATTPVSVPTRCIADDCTLEKLITLLGDQGGRIAVLSPEGDVFDLLAQSVLGQWKSQFQCVLDGPFGWHVARGSGGTGTRVHRATGANARTDSPAGRDPRSGNEAGFPGTWPPG